MKKVDFTPSEELKNQVGDVPVGTHLELMTMYVVKDSKWCIAAIEGVPMPGYDGEGNETGKQEYMDMDGGERMAGKMKEAMGSSGESGGEGY